VTHLAELVDAVYRKTGLLAADVESVLLLHGVPEHPAASPTGRHLQLHRLRVRGMKDLPTGPVPIDRTFDLETGVTVIAGPNHCGKTSLLELITLMLRGSTRNLQPDVAGWLRSVSLDVQVNERTLGLRLALTDGKAVAGTILEGDVSALAGADDDPNGCVVVERTSDEGGWHQALETQMLHRLSLEPLPSYKKIAGREIGVVSSHGWAAYFAALYPPAGASTILLGPDNNAAGVAPRLLDVFLDLPGAALRARLAAALRLLKAQDDVRRTHAGATAKALTDTTAAARTDLETARAALRAVEPGADLDAGAARVALIAAQAAHDSALTRATEASTELASAHALRIADRRALQSLIEDTAAGALFHGLNPQACPRCESSIDEDRRRQESDAHTCSVCARPVPQSNDPEAAAERRQDAEEAVAASERAEHLMGQAVEAAEARTVTAATDVEKAQAAFDRATAAQDDSGLEQARRAVAVAEGALAALESVQITDTEQDVAVIVLDAAHEVLTTTVAGAAEDLLDELNTDIADLGRSFGIARLETVNLKRNLQMPVTKGGGYTGPFGQQSAGERLRLRYALLIALLRIGRRRSIASHPGLLLLDSIRAEEVQDDDATQLLAALVEVCRDEPGLQILVTTQDTSLAGLVSEPPATISPLPGQDAFF